MEAHGSIYHNLSGHLVDSMLCGFLHYMEARTNSPKFNSRWNSEVPIPWTLFQGSVEHADHRTILSAVEFGWICTNSCKD